MPLLVISFITLAATTRESAGSPRFRVDAPVRCGSEGVILAILGVVARRPPSTIDPDAAYCDRRGFRRSARRRAPADGQQPAAQVTRSGRIKKAHPRFGHEQRGGSILEGLVMRHLRVSIESRAIAVNLVQKHVITLIADEHVELMAAGLVGQRLAGVLMRMFEECSPLAGLDLEFGDNDKAGLFAHG